MACVLSLCLAATCLADGWLVPEADARISLSVQGDLYAREQPRLETIIDFNELLGARSVLSADSLVLLDATTDEPVAIELAQDAQIRYASGNPILRLRWSCGPLPPFGQRSWHLYFRTVKPTADDAWIRLEETYVPRPRDVLLDTSFETPDPKRPNRPEFMNPGGRDVEGETTDRVWTDEEAHSGTKCLKIARTYEDGPPRNTNRPFWWTWPPAMPVNPGQSVRLTAWVKAPKLVTGALPLIVVRFCDKDRKRLKDSQLLIRGKRIPHDWVQLSHSVTAPTLAAWVIFSFSLHREGTAYFDDVRVTIIPGGALPKLTVTAGSLEDRAAFTAAQDERPEGKVLPCPETTTPPTLDGSLDDACWQTAGRISDFEVHMQIPGTQVATTVLACADRDALYFGFDCAEPSTADLHAQAAERDGRLWEDDSVELFLDTNSDLRTYYQIIVNSRGVIFDQDKGEPGLAGPKWDGPVTAAAKVLPERWTAEVRIEFTGLRLAQAKGQTWGANFARSSFRGGRSLYVWSPVSKNFGEPQHFGRVVLPFDPTANAVTGRPLARDTAFLGKGTLALEVSNQRDRPVTVRASATEKAVNEDRILGAITETIAANSVATLRIPAEFAEPGEVRVHYELAETETNRTLYATSVPHTVPEALALEPATLVSYVGEGRLRGIWILGLAEDTLGRARLAISILPAGADTPCAEAQITPRTTKGAYAVDISGLAAGKHTVRIRLLSKGKTLGEKMYLLDRIRSPFSPDFSANRKAPPQGVR